MMSQVFCDVKQCPLVNIYWRFVVESFMKSSWTIWALKCTAPTFPDYVGKNVPVDKVQQSKDLNLQPQSCESVDVAVRRNVLSVTWSLNVYIARYSHVSL